MINTGVILKSQEETGSRSQVRKAAESMELGASKFIDLVGRRGCFILMASDFLSEAHSQREGVKFKVGMGLDLGVKI